MKLIRNGNEFILKYGGETILEYSKDPVSYTHLTLPTNSRV